MILCVSWSVSIGCAYLACLLCDSVALWLVILEAGLDAGGEGAEVAYALDFVVGELDAEVIFQAAEEFESLEAVNAQLSEEVVIGRE